ncbi:hypothetical protein RV134_350223 [Roseovarius sp. EC-HK134]|nr:hypothetical protein RV420_400504 [Roseovarius sp. EC-SD190]VVT28786.1 hypothetical protein RV134_350223 [Roseovarius sp. EC-HK134]
MRVTSSLSDWPRPSGAAFFRDFATFPVDGCAHLS